MTRHAHTPGPWCVEEHDDYVRDAGGQLIAMIVSANHDEVTGYPVWTGVDDANARLIAAAPELLAVCVAMVESNMGQPRGVHVRSLDAMRDIIQSATEES